MKRNEPFFLTLKITSTTQSTLIKKSSVRVVRAKKKLIGNTSQQLITVSTTPSPKTTSFSSKCCPFKWSDIPLIVDNTFIQAGLKVPFSKSSQSQIVSRNQNGPKSKIREVSTEDLLLPNSTGQSNNSQVNIFFSPFFEFSIHS